MGASIPGIGVWILAFVSILLSAAAQLLMKVGMTAVRSAEAASLAQTALAVALNPHVDEAEMRADYAALGALNVCRILGIFSRLVIRDGKGRYAGFMPRMWKYLARCLEDPSLAPLADWMRRHAPVEVAA